MSNQTDTNNQLAVRDEQHLDSNAGQTGGFMLPQTREQFELIRELQEAESQIEALGIETTKAGDLAKSGVVFDILDAWKTELKDGDELKTVVCFKLQEHNTMIEHIVMKSFNSINEQYANYFGKWKAVGMPKTLANFRFVASEKYQKAGNKAIIFQRVNPQAVKTVSKS